MERKNQWHRLQYNDSELISLNYDKLYLGGYCPLHRDH
jgi:hypothetical protein